MMVISDGADDDGSDEGECHMDMQCIVPVWQSTRGWPMCYKPPRTAMYGMIMI